MFPRSTFFCVCVCPLAPAARKGLKTMLHLDKAVFGEYINVLTTDGANNKSNELHCSFANAKYVISASGGLYIKTK